MLLLYIYLLSFPYFACINTLEIFQGIVHDLLVYVLNHLLWNFDLYRGNELSDFKYIAKELSLCHKLK